MRFVARGLSVFFFFVLLFLIFRIWLESKRERTSPSEIIGEELPAELKSAAMRPLKELAIYYEKRDIEQVDRCIYDTMLPDEILILGTNPREIFIGRERAKNLLWGDWKYWGQTDIDADKAVFNRVEGTIYFVMRGQVKLDIWRFIIPIKITGVLRERDDKWYISKLQFINDFNTNYVIFSWGVSLALITSILLLGISWLLSL
ncbi:MAG: hypothetical protein IJ833_10780 [Lachnospiraceae bacterium]|nr:hypothetical protein [Lachnospiraceae bacterium]